MSVDYAETQQGLCLLGKNGLDTVLPIAWQKDVEIATLRAALAGADRAALEANINDMNLGRERRGLKKVEFPPIEDNGAGEEAPPQA